MLVKFVISWLFIVSHFHPSLIFASKAGANPRGVPCDTSGLYYKRVTIVIDAPSVVKVTLQIVASRTIVIDDAN